MCIDGAYVGRVIESGRKIYLAIGLSLQVMVGNDDRFGFYNL